MLAPEQLHLYQIYYDEASYAALDQGFTPLDNSANERPDWSEYWPIRRFLQEEALNENDYYAFLSPKFEQKTQMNAAQLEQFILKNHRDDVEVFTISPFWDQAAFFKNVFEQGDFWHAGLKDVAQTFFQRIGHEVNLDTLLMHSQNTVFCNYIVAKPVFWRRWLALAEQLFAMAEEARDEFEQRLSAGTQHANQHSYPFKVFLQERLASFLLATEPFRVFRCELFHLPTLMPLFEPHRSALLACDAHKQAFLSSTQPTFFDAYQATRQHIEVQLQWRSAG